MIIQGKKIIEDKLLINACESNLANATYNLTIGTILYKESEEDSIYLKPGETVCVISKEIFSKNKTNVTALVNLQSSMTKQGILALDTGYVDPTYEGPIGTILVNFSKNPVFLKKDYTFFRVMFFKHETIPEHELYTPKSYNSNNLDKAIQDYVSEQKKILATSIAGDFLNTEKLQDRVAKSVSKDLEPKLYKNATLKLVINNPIAAIFFLLLTTLSFVFGFNYFADRVARSLLNNNFQSQIFIQKVAEEMKKSTHPVKIQNNKLNSPSQPVDNQKKDE